MTAQNLGTLYAINITNNDAGNLLVDQIMENSFNFGIELFDPDPTDGRLERDFLALSKVDPRVTFKTQGIGKALAGLGGGAGLVIDGASAACTMWIQRLQNLGSRTSGSAHDKYVIADGLIVPRTVELSSNALGSIGYEIFPASTDGTTHPITRTTSQALAGSPTSNEGFVCGPIVVNGTTINGIVSATIDFGIEVKVERADGQIYVTFVWKDKMKPSITFNTLDVSAIGTVGMAGLTISSSDVVVYGQKVTEHGGRVAAATGEHLSFTLDDGYVHIGEVSGNPYTVPVTVTPTYDGTNAIVAVSTTATLP